jgi:hypothetical protein
LSALRRVARNLAPGIHGICLEFYTPNWDTIHHELLELLNQIFLHKNITPQQKRGIIVCLSKSNGDRTPEGYRPIAILTTEYKILGRNMARRLRQILQNHLRSSQFYEVHGNSILDAVFLVRDAIAYSEMIGTPLCILPLIAYPTNISFKSYNNMGSAHCSFSEYKTYTQTQKHQSKLTECQQGQYQLKTAPSIGMNVGGREEFLSFCSFAGDKINFLTKLTSRRPTFDYTTNRTTNNLSVTNTR